MESLKEIITRLSVKHEYFSELTMRNKTDCFNFAKLHRKLQVYTILLHDECTISYFLLKVLEKVPESAKPRPAAHFTHLSHVQYQLDKKKRWEVMELIKTLEVYRKSLKDLMYSNKMQHVILNELTGEPEVTERQLGLWQRDRMEDEYIAVSNYIKINIDKIV